MASTDATVLEVAGIEVQVVRKNIKNLHLGVYPPEGRVRVAAPKRVDDEAVRLAVIGKLSWIRRQQERFAKQERQTEREMVGGETHFFRGRRYRLRIVEENRAPSVQISNRAWIELRVRPGTGRDRKLELLNEWYRADLRSQVEPLIKQWTQSSESKHRSGRSEE